MFRIHDILVWIRIRGSIPLTNGSGPDAYPDPAIFVIDLQDAKKTNKKKFFTFYFSKVHLRHFSKKNDRRIRIRKAQKHVDTVEHWLYVTEFIAE